MSGVVGIREQDWRDMARIACQAPTIEFCPGDVERFGVVNEAGEPLDEQTGLTVTEDWLKKPRGVQLLRRIGADSAVGDSWIRPEKCPELPNAKATFAIRLDEELGIRGVGSLFTALTLAVGHAAYGSSHVGFESWKSNVRANGAYAHSGARVRMGLDGDRTTQYPNEFESNVGPVRTLHLPNDREVELYTRGDTRLFQEFAPTFVD
jgi:hypothetical protein